MSFHRDPPMPVTLVIVDTGPLISLAVIDRLDLLQFFGRPVFITDVVRDECVRDLSKPGAQRLKDWFELTGHNQTQVVSLIETPFGEAYRRAQAMEAEGVEDATKDFGEYSAHWVLSHLKGLLKKLHLNEGDHIGLFLAEDKKFFFEPGQRPPRTHFLITRSFLQSLENVGLIPSAKSLVDEIKIERPNFAKLNQDMPVIEGMNRSSYVESMSEILRQRIDERKKSLDPDEDPTTSPPSIKP